MVIFVVNVINMEKSRKIYIEPAIGNITQGSVFNGAISQKYEGYNVLGVIITPRCDIAQQKVPYYYYLPIVSFEDWKKVEFPSLYVAKFEKETLSKLRSELKREKISESLVGLYDSAAILDILSQKRMKIGKSLEKALKQLSALEQYNKKKIKLSELVTLYEGPKKEIFKEIVANKNLNYYLLEDNEGSFSIIRMRELNRLTPSLLNMLKNGIDTKLSDLELKENDISQVDDDLILPIFEIKSPYIEHIMQHFLLSFNRIGVEDMHETLVNKFMNSNI